LCQSRSTLFAYTKLFRSKVIVFCQLEFCLGTPGIFKPDFMPTSLFIGIAEEGRLCYCIILNGCTIFYSTSNGFLRAKRFSLLTFYMWNEPISCVNLET